MQIMEGETKSADSLLSEALTERGDREGGSSLRAGAHCWLGQLRLAEGDSTGAEREALIGLEEASRSEPVDAVPLWRLLGEALEARKAGLGLEALERARDLSRAAGMRLEEGRALMAIARRLPTEQQQATLKEARRIFEECGGARELAALDAI